MQIEIDNSGYIFKASCKVLWFAGFTAVYQDASNAKKEDEDEIIYAGDIGPTVTGDADTVLESGYVIDEDSPEDIMNVFSDADNADADSYEN